MEVSMASTARVGESDSDATLGNAHKSFEAAVAALRSGRSLESEALFTELLDVPTYRSRALYGLGFIRLKRGGEGTARAWFAECLQLDPQHADAAYQLGRIAEGRDAKEEATKYYSRAAEIKPGHAGAAAGLRRLGSPGRRAAMGNSPGSPAPGLV